MTALAFPDVDDVPPAATGSYFAVEHPGAIEYLWSGEHAREAHAALARAFARLGIEALDVPGMGVMVRKEST